MTHQNGRTSAQIEPRIRIEVFTIPPGTPLHVRMLSGQVDGLFIHWKRGGGVYCDPNLCCTAVLKPERFWRGFVAAEVYDPLTKRWMPTCFPVSERLELDLRGTYRRGQTWLIEQHKPVDKKHQPVRGKLFDQADQTSFPPAFPILPVLRTAYHAPALELGQKNPMPDIVMVCPSEAAPPKGLEGQEVSNPLPAGYSAREELEKHVKELARRNAMPLGI